MKKEYLKKELIYKESIERYDLTFTYKNHIKLVYLLPEEEKEFADELMEDNYIKKSLKLFHLFYKIFGRSTFEYFCRDTDFSFFLEGKGKVMHKGKVIMEAVEAE